MSITKNISDFTTLKINYLTDEMYEDALENGEINEGELYFTPDEGSNLETYQTCADAYAACSGASIKFNKVTNSAADGPTPNKTYAYALLNIKASEIGTYGNQIAINTDENKIYYRRMFNGTWEAWISIPGTISLSLSLPVANWSNNSQTITATGVTASNNVIISPAPASIDNYVAAGIKCTAQAANSLTFTCTTTPTAVISVNVLVMS